MPRCRIGIRAHYSIAVRVPLSEVAFHGAQHLGVVIYCQQNWLRHSSSSQEENRTTNLPLRFGCRRMKIVTFLLSARPGLFADFSFIPPNGTTLIGGCRQRMLSILRYLASFVAACTYRPKNCPGNTARTVLFPLRFLTPHEAITTSN